MNHCPYGLISHQNGCQCWKPRSYPIPEACPNCNEPVEMDARARHICFVPSLMINNQLQLHISEEEAHTFGDCSRNPETGLPEKPCGCQLNIDDVGGWLIRRYSYSKFACEEHTVEFFARRALMAEKEDRRWREAEVRRQRAEQENIDKINKAKDAFNAKIKAKIEELRSQQGDG